jgi:hypothetical protein
MTALLIANTILFGIFGITWEKSNFLNLVVKLAFISLAFWNGFFLLKSFGYIVKAVA